MKNGYFDLDPIARIELSRQRVLKRNWKFFWLPVLILLILLCDLSWEIIRTYMPMSIWPWKFTLLGIPTAGSLSGVWSGLLIARQQFAMTMKPNISWSTDLLQDNLLQKRAWVVHLLNVGPGTAITHKIFYDVELSDGTTSLIEGSVDCFRLKELLKSSGLIEGVDFYVRLLTKGLPLPPVKKIDEGIEFLAISLEKIELISILNLHVVIQDSLGDTHIKSLPFVDTIPKEFLA